MTRSPLRIDRLGITDFRGIDELELEFSHETNEGGLVVLAGDNGCGKTAVLEAILLVLGQTRLLPSDMAPLEEQARFGSPGFKIKADISISGTDASETLIADSASLREHEKISSPHGDDDGHGGLANGASGPMASDPFSMQIQDLEPQVEYFSARRDPEDLGATPDPRGAPSTKEARRLAQLKRRLVNIYFRRLRSTQAPHEMELDPFERLRRFASAFIGEDWVMDVLPVSDDPSSNNDVVLRRGGLPPQVTSVAGGRRSAHRGLPIPTILPIDRLSSGQLSLFTFAGPLVFREAPADVVVIDEPEQHLHPAWQKVLIQALRDLSPRSQFIVATHSMDVLDSAMRHECHLLLRKDDPRALAWTRRTTPDGA